MEQTHVFTNSCLNFNDYLDLKLYDRDTLSHLNELEELNDIEI